MRQAVQSPIGMISALPFFLCLMLYAGIFYIGSLTLVMTERQEIDTAIAHGTPAFQDQTLLESLTQELQKLRVALADQHREAARLQGEKTTLAQQVASWRKQEEQLARLRLSLTLRAEALAQLRGKIATLNKELAGVQREIDEKERVQAKDLVPSGAHRPAVFMECDARGVWIMPERRLLAASAPSSARQAFLSKARTTGYVVFLIRPDGFTAFENYRDVLQTHNTSATRALDLGYEPVDADWQLVYPTER